MKQTNSTITFLSAQYRAVLRDAYLKGLASTAILSTAALASVYSSAAEAAQPADLNDLEQLQKPGDYTLDSGSGPKDLQLYKKLDWQGNLTVNSSVKGNPHKIRSFAEGSDITGNGSLTVKGNGAVLAIGEPPGNYEFKMNIGKVDVQEGEIRLRAGYHPDANAQLGAENIILVQMLETRLQLSMLPVFMTMAQRLFLVVKPQELQQHPRSISSLAA